MAAIEAPDAGRLCFFKARPPKYHHHVEGSAPTEPIRPENGAMPGIAPIKPHRCRWRRRRFRKYGGAK